MGLVAGEDVLEEISVLQARMDHYERLIEQRVQADETSRRLREELNGVGKLGASALRVKVGDVRDYGNGRHFAAYIGLARGIRVRVAKCALVTSSAAMTATCDSY